MIPAEWSGWLEPALVASLVLNASLALALLATLREKRAAAEQCRDERREVLRLKRVLCALYGVVRAVRS